jgi:hypothetical protein
MRDRLIFTGQFIFTLIVAAFLVVPAFFRFPPVSP